MTDNTITIIENLKVHKFKNTQRLPLKLSELQFGVNYSWSTKHLDWRPIEPIKVTLRGTATYGTIISRCELLATLIDAVTGEAKVVHFDNCVPIKAKREKDESSKSSQDALDHIVQPKRQIANLIQQLLS